MSMLLVEVHDATGSKRQQVEVPADAPVDRVVAVLVDKLRFPQTGPDGQLLSYKLQHRGTGRQLLEDQTLASAGVASGDVLRLMPEITAGGSGRRSASQRVPIRVSRRRLETTTGNQVTHVQRHFHPR